MSCCLFSYLLYILVENKQSAEPSCEDTKCATRSTPSVTTVSPWTSVIAQSRSIPSSLLLTDRPLIILSDSMFARCLAQGNVPGNSYPPMSLLSHPPEITVLPDEPYKVQQLCLPPVPPVTVSTDEAVPNPLIVTPERDAVQSGGCSEVCVIPDSPSCSNIPDTDVQNTLKPPDAGTGFGEEIINALATSIVSLSKQETNDLLSNPEPVEMLATPVTEHKSKPLFGCTSQLNLPTVSQSCFQNPFVDFVAEKEQLLEDSDSELEIHIPSLQYNEDIAQNNSNSGSIDQEQCVESSPPMNETADCGPNTDESRKKSDQVEQCEEPLAKRQKMEITEPVEDSVIPLSVPLSEFQPGLPIVRMDVIDKNNEVTQCEAIHMNDISTLPMMIEPALPYPQEPTECVDDGLDTVEAALPIECAREHALIPNLPRCAQQDDLDSDDSDDEEEDETAAIVIIGNLPDHSSPVQTYDMTPSPQQTSLSPVLEYQVVPNVLPLDSSFSSLYPDEQDDKLEQKTTSLDGVNIENMDNTSVIEFVLERMESQQSKTTQTTQTVRLIDLSDDDDKSMKVDSKRQNCFSFRHNVNTGMSCSFA